MAGEKSVLSGEDGQKITARLLKLCGWNLSEHIDFPCLSGKRHKPPGNKGERQQHSVDGINTYSSPLNLATKKLVMVSAKHHAESYPSASPSKIYRTIKELAQCLDCATYSPQIQEDYLDGTDPDRDTEFDGLLTFFSSDPVEKNTSFFGSVFNVRLHIADSVSKLGSELQPHDIRSISRMTMFGEQAYYISGAGFR